MDIQDVIDQKSLIYDRFVDYDIKLPYDFESIKIQPNEIVSANSINQKLRFLYDNFLYLYRNTKISSSIIPVSSSATCGVSSLSNTFTWRRNLSTSEFVPFSNIGFPGYDKFDYVYAVQNRELKRYTLFCSSSSYFVAFNSNNADTTFNYAISSTDYNTEFQTNINFEKISYMVEGSQDNLFILDQGANKLYKYNIKGFKTDDAVLNDRLFFEKAIGGYGDILDKLEFNSPNSVNYFNNKIYVYDQNNKCVKIYDEDLSWQKTIGLQKDLNKKQVTRMKNDNFGNFYFIVDNNFIYKYDNGFNFTETIQLTSVKDVGEIYNDIVFSKSDNNIFYIISNKNVHKRFVSYPYYDVGIYLFYLWGFNTPYEIKSFTTTISEDSDRNILFIKTPSNNASIFSSFFDNKNLYDVLSIPNFDIYTYDEIKVDYEEYVQSWVFNKAFSKLILNHMRLRDEIIGKFLFQRDNLNNIIFNFTRYLLPEERNSILFQSDINFYVGQNEIFSNSTFNRCLEKLYTVQSNLLSILTHEVKKDPLNTIVL